MDVKITPAASVPEQLSCPPLPADKSISHRLAMFAALADGTSTIKGYPLGEDNQSTLRVLRGLGVQIESEDDGAGGQNLTIHGKGLHGFTAPSEPLDCGNSGTTVRLMMGILAGQPFESTLIGDVSLSKRPMERIAGPLRQLGAQIEYLEEDGHLPLKVVGTDALTAPGNDGVIRTSVASAQLKSALLLAGLFGQRLLTVREPAPSRDHTERLLMAMGANLEFDNGWATIVPGNPLRAFEANAIPDISSASFWLVAAAMLGRRLDVPNVGLNDGRLGLVFALQSAGLDVAVQGNPEEELGEYIGGIVMHKCETIQSFVLEDEAVVAAIDEIPILNALAAIAHGTSVFSGIGELRVKESDRIAAMEAVLHAMGVQTRSGSNWMEVIGRPEGLQGGADVDALHDHRIAMAAAVMALSCNGSTIIRGAEAADVSYPGFFDHLAAFSGAKIERL